MHAHVKFKNNWVEWLTTTIPATPEVVIRKTLVGGQPRQKVSKTPISTNKPGVVVHACQSPAQHTVGSL
jgi:hypothetical protein